MALSSISLALWDRGTLTSACCISCLYGGGDSAPVSLCHSCIVSDRGSMSRAHLWFGLLFLMTDLQCQTYTICSYFTNETLDYVWQDEMLWSWQLLWHFEIFFCRKSAWTSGQWSLSTLFQQTLGFTCARPSECSNRISANTSLLFLRVLHQFCPVVVVLSVTESTSPAHLWFDLRHWLQVPGERWL